MKRRVNHRNFGRTGPAQVLSCGCNVDPWDECEHSAWDADKSLDRIVAEAEAEYRLADLDEQNTRGFPE